MGLTLLFILLLFSAFFSCSETALTAVSKMRIAQLLERKKMGAVALNELRQDAGKMISTILIGNNIVNTWSSVLAASIAFEYFKKIAGNNESVFIGMVTFVMTFLILIFGEITPKSIAIRNAEPIALFVAPIILFFEKVFRPIAWILRFFTRPIIMLFGKSSDKKITEDEIKMVISAGEREGVIEQEEKEMLSSIFEFGDTAVSEVMTPRPDIKSIEVAKTSEDLFSLIKDVGHSRIPVFDGNIDNIVGVVYAKDLIAKEGREMKDYLRPVLIIPESKKIDDLMRQMQSVRTHMAVVVDEYGVTVGIVTLEDLIEEIVGEIHDEFEKESRKIEKLDDNAWLVDARLAVSDLEKIGLMIPEGDYDTIAGFVFTNLGKAPAVGDFVRIDGYKVSVEKLFRRRITRVKIEKIKPGEEVAGR